MSILKCLGVSCNPLFYRFTVIYVYVCVCACVYVCVAVRICTQSRGTNDKVLLIDVTNEEMLPAADEDFQNTVNLLVSRMYCHDTEWTISFKIYPATTSWANGETKSSRTSAETPGDNIAIPIPLVDRGCRNPRNI